MSKENPDIDVIVISSNDESETTPVSKSPSSVTAYTCPDPGKSYAAFNSQNMTDEIITLSSDSDNPGLSPDSDTAKKCYDIDVSKIQPAIHSSEENQVININEGNNTVEMSEEKLTKVETIDVNPEIEMIDENTRIEMIEKILKKEVIEENPDVEMIDENCLHNDEIDENVSDISDTSINSALFEGNDLDTSDIPILDVEDKERSNTPRDAKSIELVGFDLKPYCVPDSERYGNCRLITEFEKICYAGRGSFGVVYKVLDVKNEIIVALKKMKISLRDDDPLSVNVMREMNLLIDLEHPNIVNMKGVAVGRNFDSTYLILDCCDYDLAKVIDDEKSSAMLEEPQIKSIMLQLFEGLKFIHKNCIIHRDLSCSNVLFTFEGILKIGDFGLSRIMPHEEPMTPNIGSRWYRSIELLFGSAYYSFAVDLWSAGCIFSEVILKKPLFKAKTDMDVISLIIDLLGSPNETTWPGCSQLPVLELYELRNQPKNRLKSLFSRESKECLNLLNQLLTFDPKQRIDANAAFSHPYFSEDPPACSPGDLIPILEITDEIETERHDKCEDEAAESEMNTG